jgi:hypothetical protein
LLADGQLQLVASAINVMQAADHPAVTAPTELSART